MKRCFQRVFSCLLALTMVSAHFIPASATPGREYIREIRIGYDQAGQEALTAAGFTVWKNPDSKELFNVNIGGTGSAVYLGYTTTKNKDEAITDVAVIPMEDTGDDSYPQISERYQLVMKNDAGETMSFEYYAARAEGVEPYTEEDAETEEETNTTEESSETENRKTTAKVKYEETEEGKEADEANDTAYSSPTSLIFGDLNGNNQKSPWLCLYYTRDLRLGSPLTADILIQSSIDLSPTQREFYLPIHEMEDYKHLSYLEANAVFLAPFNLRSTSNAYGYTELYVFLKRDTLVSPKRILSSLGDRLTAAAIGFSAGVLLTAVVIIPVTMRKKRLRKK